MSVIRDWFRSAASNSATSPHGSPEGMARSGVNNSVREIMASIKIFFDSPGMREPFADYTFARVNGGVFLLFDGAVESDASGLLEDGQRIRMIGKGADLNKTWEGFVDVSVASIVYDSGPGSTTFGITWILADSEDENGPTETPSAIFVGLKELGRAAWYDTGVVNGTIPRVDDLDPHVFLAEEDLSVDKIDGQTREQIAMSAARSPLNINGALDHWQRGTNFTSTSVLNNDDNNVLADGWTLISDGDDACDVTRSIDVPANESFVYSMRFDQETADKKHGAVIPIEHEDTMDVANGATTEKISASFWAKFDNGATGVTLIRAYLMNLKARAVTLDPVSNWQSGSSIDITPTSEWEIITSTVVTLTGDWQEFKPSAFENQSPDVSASGVGPLAIMFHTDHTTVAPGARWFVTGAQVNRGEKTLPFIREPAGVSWARCQRYCVSTLDDGRIGTGWGQDEALGAHAGDTTILVDWRFPIPMYKNPTLVTFNPRIISPPTGDFDTGTTVQDIAVDSSQISTRGCTIKSADTATVGRTYYIAAYAHANIWGAN